MILVEKVFVYRTLQAMKRFIVILVSSWCPRVIVLLRGVKLQKLVIPAEAQGHTYTME